MSQVWFVTGAGRGLGVEIARAALAAGEKVVATGRNPERVAMALGTSDRLLATELDVTRQNQIQTALRTATGRFGRIDVLVNNAGYGQLGVFEESTPAEIHAQFDTNVFGLMAVTRAIIPGMRKQRSGRIFNISSIGGLRGMFGASLYNASKFAVEGFSQALADELAPFGVYVTCVAPGFFRTDFLDPSSIKYTKASIKDYAQSLAEFRAFHDARNHTQAGDPKKLAAVILRLAQVDNPPVSFVVGPDAVKWARAAIKQRLERIDTWHDLSVSTDGTWYRTDFLSNRKEKI